MDLASSLYMAHPGGLPAPLAEGAHVSFLEYVRRVSAGLASRLLRPEAVRSEGNSPVSCRKEGSALVQCVGKRGTGDEECRWPCSIVMSHCGDIVVADRAGKSLKVYSKDGGFQRKIPLSYKPVCIALLDSTTLVITGDAQNIHLLDYLQQKDRCVLQVKETEGTVCPAGVAVDSLGRIIIISHRQGYVINCNGDILTRLTMVGESQMGDCLNMTTNSKNNIILSDFHNSCVHVFDSTGQYVHKFNSCGCESGQLDHPVGICTDDTDNILVADSENHRIAKFSATGDFVKDVVTRGDGLKFPYGVTMSQDLSQLLVCDCDLDNVIKVFSSSN